MKVSVFDYGAGNLHSLIKALMQAGAEVRVEEDLGKCLDSQLLVLPGVGAFGQAAQRMGSAAARAHDALKAGLPCLGVCLGMQLLFERSDEGPGEGIGFFKGPVTLLSAERIPQIGWNALEDARGAPFVEAPMKYAYYANGFVCRPTDPGCIVAWSRHEEDRFPAAVRQGNVLGVQFHPEKSSKPGLQFVSAFLRELT
jgi:glutamine amidotransferase